MMARNNANNSNSFSRDRRARPKPISVSAGSAQVGPAPQSARSQLLAGLRTAPRQNPVQAPYSATMGSNGAAEYYAALAAAQNPHYMQQMQMHGMVPDYDTPEMDPEYVAQLQATEAFLLHRQQMLQNQIMQLTAQQFGGMSLAGQHDHQLGSIQHHQHQLLQHHQQQQQLQQQQQQQQLYAAAAAASGQTSLYAQQLQNGVSPIPQEVPGQPGLYLVYNPLTGQHTYAYDPVVQQQMGTMLPPNALPIGSTVQSPGGGSGSRDTDAGSAGSNGSIGRGGSPTKTGAGSPSQSAQKPSRHASRPSQTNARESSPPSRLQKLSAANAAKSSSSKPVGAESKGKFMTPFRQPYNPPPIAEIRAAPDSSIEGCKNFASMRRGEAIKKLVSAGISRRSGQQMVSTPMVTVADYGFDQAPDCSSSSQRKLGSCGVMGAFTAATPMVLVPGSEGQ